MNHVQLLAVLVALCCAPFCGAAQFSIESDDFVALPKDIEATVRTAPQTTEFLLSDKCEFVGRKVVLRSDPSASDWFVTTSRCVTAAASSPIWIVMKTRSGYSVVLSTMTYSITVGPEKQGVRNIATGRGTAGWMDEQLWKFDGSVYRLAKSKTCQSGENGWKCETK